MVTTASFELWRPLVYIIPKNKISIPRMKLVPITKRAGLGDEYIIEDLTPNEFDIIEI